MSISAEELIHHFQLEPHPEGGHYRRSYQSPEEISRQALPSRFGGARSFSTAIYYLLRAEEKSKLHRICSDEIWHFYLGDPLCIVELRSNGNVTQTFLGSDLELGQQVQHVVRAGTFFGAYLIEGGRYSLVGCTVAPGFDFSDFEVAQQSQLIAQFPAARALIERLSDG